MKRNFIKGFTLAEVLITLTVIGVIAALTIPSLITNIQDAQYKTAFKKVYSDISQATLKMQTDNTIYTGASNWGMLVAYRNYLSIVKTDTIGNTFSFQTPFQYYLYYGGIDTDWQNYATYSGGAQLNNGVLLGFSAGSATFASGYTCIGTIYVDVNGPKGPNMWGKDLQLIGIYQLPGNGGYAALPWGTPVVQDGYSCVHGSVNYHTSRGCSYYALNDQPMP